MGWWTCLPYIILPELVMKKSIYAGAAFFLIVTSSFPSAWGSEKKDNFKVSIGNGVAFPNTVGFPGAAHDLT